MWHVSLEVPLSPFPIIGSRQRCDPANTWIEAHRNPFDRSALTRGIASLEQNYDFLAGGDDPILQLHQFRLEPEQLAEIMTPVVLLRLAIRPRCNIGERMPILDFHFHFLIVA